MNQENLVQERIGDQTFWLAPHLPLAKAPSPTAHLLPNYDEYLISYRNSDPFLDPAHANMIERQNPLFAHFLVVDGRLLGTWRRDFEKDRILITLRRFVELSDEQEASVRKAGAAFGNFLGLDAAYQSAQTP